MFTTYSASAGSGKTTHLVADYITLCFRNVKPSTYTFHNILGITFTNNAAAEMKERIVKSLNAFAFTSKDQLQGSARCIYQMVAENLWGKKCNIDTEREIFLQRQSLYLLQNIVYDYARFTLSTIDSFFQNVIRASALSLNLDINYSVLIKPKEFEIQAVDQLLNELSQGDALAPKVLFMLENRLADNGSINMDKELLEVLDIRYDNREKNYHFLDKMVQLTPEEHKTIIQNWRKELKALPTQAAQTIKSIAAEGQKYVDAVTNSGISFSSRTLKTWFTDIVKNPFDKYKADISVFYRKDTTSLYTKKVLKPDLQVIADQNADSIEKCFNQLRDALLPLRQRYLDLELVLKHAEQLLLMADLENKMNEIMKYNNFFILSEANFLIHENIKGQDTPPLYERVRYENFFIDEFQDTSLMQWLNLLPLIENNALAHNGRQVTLFGDVKQAIYRFRNGEADLFYNLIDYDRLKKYVLAPKQLIDKDFNKETLSSNYRSLKSVVEFNNEFFQYYSNELGLGHYYEDVCQKVENQSPGFVRVFFENKDSKSDNDDITLQEEETLLAVQDALDRGYAFGDIAVIYSGNDKCTRIANLMLAKGWNVVTERSLSLESAPEVALILATLQYLLQPQDVISQAAILHHYATVNEKDESIDQLLFQLREDNFFKSKVGVDFKPAEWRALPLFLMVQEIIRCFGLNKLKSPFIVDFENRVLEFTQTRNGGLAQFMIWWRLLPEIQSVPTLTLPSKTDAITVTTIHKSKGLEYPVVVLPCGKRDNRTSSIWTETTDGQVAYIDLSKTHCEGSSFSKDYDEEAKAKNLDELNKLYVAHTRASEMLYVIAKLGSENSMPEYGDYLYTYIVNNEQSTHENGTIAFQKGERYYTAGAPDWRMPQDKQRVTTSLQEPAITLPEASIGEMLQREQYTPKQTSDQLVGTRIHDYLAKLTTFPQTESEIEQLTILEDETLRGSLHKALKTILQDEKMRPYFAPDVQVLNEVTIVDAHGQERRPDRIVFLDGKVVVIDYKTGKPLPQYQEQIDTYCNLLTQMGYNQVEGHLLYI